jgi:hypothetical protein
MVIRHRETTRNAEFEARWTATELPGCSAHKVAPIPSFHKAWHCRSAIGRRPVRRLASGSRGNWTEGCGREKTSKGFGRRTDLTRVWMRGADWSRENPACGIWTAGRDGALARDARALWLSGGQERPTVEVMDEGRTLAVELCKKSWHLGVGVRGHLGCRRSSVLFCSHCLPSEGRFVVMPPVVTSQSSCTTHRRPSCIMVGCPETILED